MIGGGGPERPEIIGPPTMLKFFKGFPPGLSMDAAGGMRFFTGVFLPGVGVAENKPGTTIGGGGGAPEVGKGAKVFCGVFGVSLDFFGFFGLGVSSGAGVRFTGPGPYTGLGGG